MADGNTSTPSRVWLPVGSVRKVLLSTEVAGTPPDAALSSMLPGPPDSGWSSALAVAPAWPVTGSGVEPEEAKNFVSPRYSTLSW